MILFVQNHRVIRRELVVKKGEVLSSKLSHNESLKGEIPLVLLGNSIEYPQHTVKVISELCKVPLQFSIVLANYLPLSQKKTIDNYLKKRKKFEITYLDKISPIVSGRVYVPKKNQFIKVKGGNVIVAELPNDKENKTIDFLFNSGVSSASTNIFMVLAAEEEIDKISCIENLVEKGNSVYAIDCGRRKKLNQADSIKKEKGVSEIFKINQLKIVVPKLILNSIKKEKASVNKIELTKVTKKKVGTKAELLLQIERLTKELKKKEKELEKKRSRQSSSVKAQVSDAYKCSDSAEVIDVGTSKKQSNELRLKLLESVVENAKDSVMITDGISVGKPYAKILYVNKAFTRMTGYKEEEVIGKSPKIVQGPKTDITELAKLKAAMEAKEACEIEVINYKKCGEEFWVNFSVVPIVDESGDLSHFIAIERDVTVQKKLLEEKKKILESISDCFFVLDKEYKISYMNSASEKQLRLKSGELDGIVLWDKYPALKKGIFYEKLQEAIRTRLPVHFEYFFEKDKKWYDESIFPSDDGISIFFRPIDDRKRAEALLKSALKEKNDILESFGEGFFAIDDNWVVTYWNRKAEQITGVKKKYIMHRDFRSKFKSNLSEHFYNCLATAIKERVAVHFVEFSKHYKQWFEISVYPSGKGLSVYFKNVTIRINSQEQLNKLNTELKARAEQLSASNAELERFAYVVSHDLQEPLRMISGFLQLLQKKYANDLDETGNKYINVAVNGAERMKALIHDLLHYSGVGTVNVEKKSVDMNSVLDDILALYKDRNIELRKENLPIIAADKTEMTQLLQNLIGNALKYNTNNKLILTINSKETNNCWQFSIEDNGIGIDSRFFEKIFVVFQRLHNKDEYSGTGVGLAICKKIVERYKGKIWVESELGKGSKFMFTIAKNLN